MRNRRVRNRFEFVYLKNTKIRLPLVIREQWVIIRAEILWRAHPRDRLIEHPTKGHTVYIVGVHTEADDPSSKLIHDNENPVRPQGDGFTPKQIDAPETIFCVADEKSFVTITVASLACQTVFPTIANARRRQSIRHE